VSFARTRRPDGFEKQHHATFDRLYRAAFGPRNAMILLIGPSESGKDHLIWSIAREHQFGHRHVRDGVLLHWPRLCLSRYRYEDLHSEKVDRSGVLILSDLRAPRDGYEGDMICEIVDRRYRTGMPLFMTAQIQEEEQSEWERFGEDFYRRIDEVGGIIKLPWGRYNPRRDDQDGSSN
jgi:DNA replication protein DnaC